MGIALGTIFVLGGLVYVTDWRGVSRHVHSMVQERWVSLDHGLVHRCARIYFIPGALPFWVFRISCFVFGICGGSTILIDGLG